MAFSESLLPDNPNIRALAQDLQQGRNGGVTTGIYTLAEEKKHNPFMMVSDPQVQRIIGGTNPVNTMHLLREAKNRG